MALRKVSQWIPSCDGCGRAWSFFDPACVDGIPPHFAGKRAALEQLAADYGWRIQSRWLGPALMACRTCVAAGVIPAGPFGAWLLACAGSAQRWVPLGRPIPAGPGPGHPESLTRELPPEDEELLAAIEDQNFPETRGLGQ
jgi:hypothetical protein